ncbi:MAG: hypothetical protein KF685_04325 [Acidobacteria bacterium]|nr:hypothetical protein [Acidobacteriota bacterium]
MKKIQEKVKDIVDVRPYRGLRDFAADARQTLEHYCFTDDTSALMAKWVNAAATVSPQNGIALALAGYRGVGKSHFLAAFGTILALSELRSKVGDGHVAAAAQGLLRRHYPLVSVRRGSQESLVDEIKEAIRNRFGPEVQFNADTPAAILTEGIKRAGDLPLVVIIDTAFERGNRVARNDGAILGEAAEFAQSNNMLLCVALDDDIAGADGSNAAIVRTFKIDYLDQEHLYKVVNSHIFPKNGQKQPIIEDIYQFFCSVVPNFRWSSQRFVSLYPLHPGILEISPYVRLYVHDFALLSFAAEAGERILGRPANSLIAFDEVFDKAEPYLRKIEDLADAFQAYDKLNTEVVSKIPVIQRLQAKLILKALLLLSLNGRGATAEDICSAMLIFDEAEPVNAVNNVRSIIELFSQALPEDITTIREESSGDTLFSFRVQAKENINSALQEAVAEMDRKDVPSIIRGLLQERYPDFSIPVRLDGSARPSMDSIAVWRGGQRRGRIYWREGDGSDTTARERSDDVLDWEVTIDLGSSPAEGSVGHSSSGVVWKPDSLKNEEIDTLLKHHLLKTENNVVDRFGEHVRASIHSHRVAAERIVDRIMLQNGNLRIDGFDYNFTEEALSADTISGLISSMLEPLFETRFPLHPHFGEKLGMAEVSKIVSELYAGSRQNLEEVQHLARTFSLPLGLVRYEEGKYLPETAENLEKLPSAVEILKSVNEDENGTVSLQSIYLKLRQPPYGLVREAQHLIFAALVAERKIEFLTSKGDRISSRSLDLKIIWDDIVGVAKPLDSSVSGKRLITWAQKITGDQAISSVEKNEDVAKITESLLTWLSEWDNSGLLNRMERTPDDQMNTLIWTEAARLRKTFGIVADEIRNFINGNSYVETVLSRISDVFHDSEDEYDRSLNAMADLTCFLAAVKLRIEIVSYVAACEPTGDSKLEDIRQALLASLDSAVTKPSETRNREAGYLWEQFRRGYVEVFATQHDQIMRSHDLQEKFDEILRTDIWWEFERLSDISTLRGPEWASVKAIMNRFRQLDCKFDVRAALLQRPSCICGFYMREANSWQQLPDLLWSEITKGQAAIRSRLREMAPELSSRMDELSRSSNDSISQACREMAAILRSNKDLPRLSDIHLIALRRAFTRKIIEAPLPDEDTHHDVSGFDQKVREALSGPIGRPIDSEEAMLIEM